MKHLLWGLSLAFLGLNASAQSNSNEWKTQTSNGYTYKTVSKDPTATRFYKLKNDLTVILSVNKETPRIQTIIATKAGSKTDPATHTGLAHYLEHMLFKGTDKYGSLDWKKEKPLLDQIDALYEQYNSTKDEAKRKVIYHNIDSVSGEAAKFAIANEYDKMMSMLGAQGTNAFTSFEQTAYINDIPTNQIDRWLTIEAERFRNPILRIFHTELEAVYEEKNRSLDSDDDKVFELLFSKLFQRHNYGLQTTIGTIEHLKNPSLNEIRKYFYKNYVPNNMCIVMAGDFNPDDVIVKIDKSFGYMKPKPVEPYTFVPEDEIKSPIEATVYGPDAEYVDIAFRFPGASSKEATILNFMSSVLSNGNAGLMDLNLVKKQEVLSASAGAYTLKDYGVLFMEGKAKEGQPLEEVKSKMLSMIDLLKSGSFDDEILTAIINNYKKSLIQQRETNGGRAFGLLESFTSEVDWKQTIDQLDEMSKLTKKDIQDFAKKWLNQNYVCIYKRIGKDENVLKVEKPEITPVTVNRDAQSDFVKTIAATPVKPIQPVFVNFDKDIEKTTLDTRGNSLMMYSVKNTSNPLFSQYFYVNIGKLDAKVLPIAMDYLQYLGTSKYSAEEISKKFYTLACDFGVSVSDEESYVYLEGLQDSYKEAFELFEHLLADCQPNQEALRDMIAGMKKKRSDSKLNKNVIRSGLRYYAQYGAKNPFNNELTNEELDQLKAEDLVAWLHQLTSYDHKVLYYGPATASEVAATVKEKHIVPMSFKPLAERKKFTYTEQKSNEVLFADYDMVQAEIQWFRNNETYTPEKVPMIQMFNEYFGGNMSGIVFQEIRESKALAYSTFAAYGTPSRKNEPFYMTAYVGCQADKMKEAIAGMQELVTTLPLSEKLFAQSKTSMKNTISTTRTTKTGILFSYLSAQRRGLDYDMSQKVYSAIDKFTLKDVESFFNTNISKKPYTLTVVGGEGKVNWDELKKFGPVKKLTLTEIFGY